MAIGISYSMATGVGSVPWTAMLVAPAMYASCLLAAATALPLLGRWVQPSELRYA